MGVPKHCQIKSEFRADLLLEHRAIRRQEILGQTVFAPRDRRQKAAEQRSIADKLGPGGTLQNQISPYANGGGGDNHIHRERPRAAYTMPIGYSLTA